MANEVEIHVTAKDVDTEKTFNSVRAKAKRAGSDAGDDFSGSFSGNLKLDDATNKQADEVRKSAPRYRKAGEDLGEETRQGYKKKTDEIPKDTEKVAKRTQAQFEAMQYGLMFAGMPAAAAVASAATVGSLAAVGAGWVGLAAVALRSDQDVSKSYEDLGSHVKDSIQQLAAPLKGDLIDSAHKLGTAFDQLQPQISSAMLNSRADVGILTDGVISLATEAMPGLVVASKASTDTMRGLGNFLTSTGRGLTDFFVNVSQGSVSSERNLTLFGGTLQRLLGFAGSLLANLSNNGTHSLQQFDTGLSLVEHTLLTLTSNGSAAISMLTGFASTTNGALTILNSAATLLNLMPGQVTQFGGALLATSKIAGMFGIDVFKAFDGLGEKVKEAEGFGAKVKTTFSGLVAGAFNPATAAAGAVAVGLALLGQRQQEAAADAAAHASRVRDLSSALQASGGAITQNVRSLAQNQLANMQFADGTRNLLQDVSKLAGPSGINLLTDGYLGNGAALDQLKTKLQENIDAHTHVATGVELLTTKFGDMRTMAGGVVGALDDTGKANQQLLDIVNSEGGTFGQASKFVQDWASANNSAATSAHDVSYAQKLAQEASGQLNSAFQTLASTENDVATKGTAMQTILDQLTGRAPSHEEAVQSINDTLRQLGEEFTSGANKADGWGKALLNSDGTVNTFTKNGSALQDSLVTLQKGFADTGASVDELVRGGMSLDAATAQVNNELTTQRNRFIDVATHMGLTKTQAEELANKYGLLPGEIATTIDQPGMQAAQQAADILRGKVLAVPNQWTTVTSALTADAMKKLEDLGYTVKTLPNGQVIVTAPNAGDVDRVLNGLVRTRTATIVVNTVNGTTTAHGIGSGAYGSMQAHGGLVGPPTKFIRAAQGRFLGSALGGGFVSGPGTTTSDSVLLAASNKEYVVNARATAEWLPTLEAINSGQTPRSVPAPRTGGGGANLGGGAMVVLRFEAGPGAFDQAVVELLQRYVRVRGGDVQAVLGRN